MQFEPDDVGAPLIWAGVPLLQVGVLVSAWLVVWLFHRRQPIAATGWFGVGVLSASIVFFRRFVGEPPIFQAAVNNRCARRQVAQAEGLFCCGPHDDVVTSLLATRARRGYYALTTLLPIDDARMLTLGFPLAFFVLDIFFGMGAFLTENCPTIANWLVFRSGGKARNNVVL